MIEIKYLEYSVLFFYVYKIYFIRNLHKSFYYYFDGAELAQLL